MIFFGFVTKNPKNLLIMWKTVQENLADYFTKHHSAKHHNVYIICIYIHIKRHNQVHSS